jgi:hypothetical protein
MTPDLSQGWNSTRRLARGKTPSPREQAVKSSIRPRPGQVVAFVHQGIDHVKERGK